MSIEIFRLSIYIKIVKQEFDILNSPTQTHKLLHLLSRKLPLTAGIGNERLATAQSLAKDVK